MDHQNANNDFYEFCFPDISKPTGKDFQSIFSDYGCMEAVNLEYDELEQKLKFTAKKQKPVLVQDDDKKLYKWIFLPKQPVLPLGKPPIVTKLLKQPILKDMFSGRVCEGRKYSKLANAEEQIENLIVDHCDVAQGTFLELLAHYFPFSIQHQSDNTFANIYPDTDAIEDCDGLPRRFFPPTGFSEGHRFPTELDPFMFDVPHSLLNELLLEEMSMETKHVFYDSHYSGGALCYKHIESRKNYDYGLLVRAAGPAMDELSLQLLCTDTCKTYDDTKDEEFIPKLHLGSDYRFTLNGRILQTDVQASRYGDRRLFIGTRSQHHVLLSSVNGNKTELSLDGQGNYTGLQYSSKSCAKHIGVLQSPHVVTSMSVSPYVKGECIVATDDGNLYLWKASLHSKAKVSKKKAKSRGLEVIMNEDMSSCGDTWRQVEFAAHPRQVLIADRNKVNLIDIRQRSHSTRGLCLSKSPGDQGEMISTILGGSNFSRPHEFQCIVATPTELMLMDTRHCHMPLLRWSLNMRYPCQHLSCVGAAQDPSHNDLSSAIFAANQRAQEIHMYQYGMESKPANPVFETSCFQRKIRPPVSLATAYSVGSFKDVRRSVMAYPQRCLGYTSDRLSYPIIGLTGYDFKDPGRNGSGGVVALQLSSCGDLLYQTFTLQDPNSAWDEANVISGPVARNASILKEKFKRKELSAERLYRKWAEKATKGYLKAVKKENPFNLRSSHTTMNHFNFSTHQLLPDLLKNFKAKQSKNCVMCKDICSYEVDANDSESKHKVPSSPSTPTSCENSLPNAQSTPVVTEPLEMEVCSSCKLPMTNTEAMLINSRAGVFHPGNKAPSDTDIFGLDEGSSYHRGPIQELKLVNPVVSKKGLGRVLTYTWDKPYEDLWEIFRQEFLSEKKEEEKQNREKIFDLTPKTVTAPPPLLPQIPPDRMDLYEISSTTDSDGEDAVSGGKTKSAFNEFSFSARRRALKEASEPSASKFAASSFVADRPVVVKMEHLFGESLPASSFDHTCMRPKRQRLDPSDLTQNKDVSRTSDSTGFLSFLSTPKRSNDLDIPENQPVRKFHEKTKDLNQNHLNPKAHEPDVEKHSLTQTPTTNMMLKNFPSNSERLGTNLSTSPTSSQFPRPFSRVAKFSKKKPLRKTLTGFF